MKKTLLASLIGMGLMITGGALYNSSFAQSAEKTNVENVAKQYVNVISSIDVFPDYKINQTDVDDAGINEVITNKQKALDQVAKPRSEANKKWSAIIELAMKDQQRPKEAQRLKNDKDPNKPGENKTPIKKGKDGETFLIRTFEGYATDLNIQSVNINGNNASVKLSFVKHATYGKFQNGQWNKVFPSGLTDLELQLEKSSTGEWYVTSDKMKAHVTN